MSTVYSNSHHYVYGSDEEMKKYMDRVYIQTYWSSRMDSMLGDILGIPDPSTPECTPYDDEEVI